MEITKETAKLILEMMIVVFDEGLLNADIFDFCKELRDKFFPGEYNLYFNK
jgi:hypothetical protein